MIFDHIQEFPKKHLPTTASKYLKTKGLAFTEVLCFKTTIVCHDKLAIKFQNIYHKKMVVTLN